MRNERAWPQQCWKSCPNGSNIVALRFGDHGTKEMLGVVGWKVWPVSNFAQQHPATCNRVCKRAQHVTSHNVGRFWPTTLRLFAQGFRQRRRLRKRHLKSEVALPINLPRLFHLVWFVKCWQISLELNSKGFYQKFWKRKRKLLFCVPVLEKTWN